MVNEKELYQKQIQAKVNEWKAELNQFKEMLAGTSTDAQLKMKEQIKELEGKIEEGETKLSELSETSDDAWDSIKESVKSTWESWNLPGIH
jgi:archaellum component FlaC